MANLILVQQKPHWAVFAFQVRDQRAEEGRQKSMERRLRKAVSWLYQ